MDDAFRVRVFEPGADLGQQLQRDFGRHASQTHDLGEVGAIDELHDEVQELAAEMPVVVDGDDIWVI